jgi:prolyl 4-hydroxylase
MTQHGQVYSMESRMTMLSTSWIDWISTNLIGNCDPDQMAFDMVKSGEFTIETAKQAIAFQQKELRNTSTYPAIDVGANQIVIDGRKIDLLSVNRAPRIVLLGNVLDDEECDALVEHGSERFEPSPVIDYETGGATFHPGRTSKGVMFGRGETDIIERVENRLALLAQWPVENGEGLQLQQYGVDNEYRAHYDWFDTSIAGASKQMANGGQRLATFILYLTDVEAGGGTSFPNIGLEISPKKGNVLFFSNVNSLGEPDRLTFHAGMPVVKGVKIIANKWLRERRY